jgi:hypothetical protein
MTCTAALRGRFLLGGWMNWIVTVTNGVSEFKYWIEASDAQSAEARAVRIHGSTPNFAANGQDRVTECRAAK